MRLCCNMNKIFEIMVILKKSNNVEIRMNLVKDVLQIETGLWLMMENVIKNAELKNVFMTLMIAKIIDFVHFDAFQIK